MTEASMSKTIQERCVKIAVDFGVDVEVLKKSMETHGIVAVKAEEHKMIGSLVLRVSDNGLRDPESRVSQYLMYDLNAYIARNGLRTSSMR